MMIQLYKKITLILITLLSLSCSNNADWLSYTHTNQKFIVSNLQDQKLFNVTAPIGKWRLYDRTKEKQGTKNFSLSYNGKNSGMINANIRIAYLESPISDVNEFIGQGNIRIKTTLETYKKETSIYELNKSMARLLSKDNPNNLQDFYKPKSLKHGIKNIAGLHCRYFSIVNHSGPKLDTPTAKFRGLGSARKQEEYLCPVIRDGTPWALMIDIVYLYSDQIHTQGLDIDFYETIKDFDRMLKPTIESLKLYGKLKQY